jgi:single-stranded-DNA-specific exonuclease
MHDPLRRRVELPPYDLDAALALEQELGISHVLAQVMVRRGLHDADSVREFLEPSERHDAAAFSGMEAAVDQIVGQIAAGGRIVVHGDYDVDGVCATAILVRALRALGADVGFYIPSRSDDGYGLAAATVERLAARGTALLITVDCGITAVEEVAAARAAGIDVLITDHHSPRADGQLPDCAILHPALSGYPFQELCGAAVAHKLAEALDAPTAPVDLELVALATVADLMPLRGENRRIVRDGLAQMAVTQRTGLRALLSVSSTDPAGLDATALGFRLAPRINAAGRMRRADAALELLLTDDPQRAQEVAQELDRVNAERRAVEDRISWQAQAMAAEMGDRPAYVLAAEGWHPGVIGIVASRIVERFNRPAILIALDGAAPAAGSGRSIKGFDLLGGLTASEAYLLRYGGHRMAAGVTIEPGRLDAFRETFEAHAGQLLTPDLLQPVQVADAVVSGADLSLPLAEELLALQPCGMGNPAPTLMVSGARFDGVKATGDGKHARFTVISGAARAGAVAFGCDGKLPGAEGRPVDAAFRLERNVWRGVVEPRLVLRSAYASNPQSITVLGEADDYVEAALAELDRALEPSSPNPQAGGDRDRIVLDRRGESPLAVLADAAAAADEDGVLAICADVPRRLTGLSGRAGGFALVSHAGLAEQPWLVEQFGQVVVLDPPSSALGREHVLTGFGYAHLCWGEAELRFAQQIHELEYGLRTSLVTLYKSLRERGRVAGEELESLLRGDDTHARSARLAGRLLRVFTELELVSLDRRLPSLELAGTAPTQLERSVAFRDYTRTFEDGQLFLSSVKARRTN